MQPEITQSTTENAVQAVPLTQGNQTYSQADSNGAIAERLDQIAELLEAQNANPYRVLAYRNAAETLRSLPESAAQIYATAGEEGLRKLPGIGRSLARVIRLYIENGRIPLLEQLRGAARPERVLATVPTIGPKLAQRIHKELGIESLADLENAAYDGRLNNLPGFGSERLRAVRESLAGRLHRPRRFVQKRTPSEDEQTPVSLLLEIDRQYRMKAQKDQLLRIAPRRFNPTGEAWLPVMNTKRDGVRYTALYSNSAHAHEAGGIRDWVVIYRNADGTEGAAEDADGHAGQRSQWTVITSQFGPLQGKRIVRGREKECLLHYTATPN